MKHSLAFKPLKKADLRLVFEWFQELIIKQSYARNQNWPMEAIEAKYMPRIEGKDPVPSFIIYSNQKPIGFIQYYCLKDHYPEGVSSSENKLFSEISPEEVVGIDLFIAEESHRGKGLGQIITHSFITEKLAHYKAVVVDPSMDNIQAIRCYQKAGFSITMHSQNPEYVLMLKAITS
ncbi:GNAT family N-acetyltransferase [Legionella santicrucis]|nr:GNAT family N-acetyltransferase [Legionella santicrucis]